MPDPDDSTLPDPGTGTNRGSGPITADLGDRYTLGHILGRGGMGEVRLARDTRIDRDVAIKLMRATDPDDAALSRFFREARVQDVLDHPAVVPVHDLGFGPDGQPFFVMKRLTGTTLAAVLAPPGDPRWPRRQLLAHLADICLAIEFAHTRGVVHRDLKPGNVMLGDFGEAYVIDWGLARIAEDRPSRRLIEPISSDGGDTVAGELLGTPGYMSPEQARGEPVDWRTDVFALGCILYEILAGRPALPRGLDALGATLAADDHRPSAVAAEVPPELDDLCARASRQHARERPTARVLAEGLQAYLDGDRDHARRRALAEEHAQRARAALANAADEERATAMREAGRALALDPANGTAQGVLASLLISAPKEIPAAALAAAEADRAHSRIELFRRASHGFAVMTGMSVGSLLLPVRHTELILASIVILIAGWLVAHKLSRGPVPGRSPYLVAMLAVVMLLITVTGMMFGALLLMPLFIVGAIAAFLTQPGDYPSWVSAAGCASTFVIVLALELLGVLPRSMDFHDGSLVLTARIIDLTPVTTVLVVGLSILGQILSTASLSGANVALQRATQDAIHNQTWHLRQLLPDARP